MTFCFFFPPNTNDYGSCWTWSSSNRAYIIINMIDTSKQPPGLRPKKLSVSVLALLAICMFTSVKPQALVCVTNCESCSGTGSGQCNSCTVASGKVLQTGNCVNTCSAGYTVDTRDRICKRTKVAFDFPCAPGTYNDQTSQSLTTSCQSCLPGKYASISDHFWRLYYWPNYRQVLWRIRTDFSSRQLWWWLLLHGLFDFKNSSCKLR